MEEDLITNISKNASLPHFLYLLQSTVGCKVLSSVAYNDWLQSHKSKCVLQQASEHLSSDCRESNTRCIVFEVNNYFWGVVIKMEINIIEFCFALRNFLF